MTEAKHTPQTEPAADRRSTDAVRLLISRTETVIESYLPFAPDARKDLTEAIAELKRLGF